MLSLWTERVFLPDMLVFPAMLERGGRNAGAQRMRLLAVIALAMLLAGCEGDRIKQSKNAPQAHPQSTGLLT